MQNRKDTVTVTEKYHERDSACDASFMMWSMERDGIQYGFDQKAFTREEAMDYMLEVEEGIHTIRAQMKDVASFSRDRRMQILVLNDTSTAALAGTEEVLVLDRTELETGEYRFPLFLSICGLPENSHSFEAYAYVFNIGYDNDLIREYLSREENLAVLNLFYPRISGKCSEEEDAKMFAQILASLAEETIREVGPENYLREPVTEKAVNDWLRKIGSDRQYADGSLDCLNQLEFHRDSANDFNITCGNATYLVRDFRSLFDSVSELEELLVWEIRTRDSLEQYLRGKNVSSPMFDPDFRLTYEFQYDKSAIGFEESKESSSRILLYDASKETLTHELTHAFSGIVVKENKRWMHEGFAEFFSMVVFTDPSRKDAFCNGIRDVESTRNLDLCMESYVKVEGVPEKPEDLNMSTFLDAALYGYWCGDEELQLPILMHTLADTGHIAGSEIGAELSYWEAESFVAYLIENYSFEDTWNCMTSDMSFEEVYGKPYQLLKREWMFHIRKKFS